jgi:hypothetical protein
LCLLFIHEEAEAGGSCWHRGAGFLAISVWRYQVLWAWSSESLCICQEAELTAELCIMETEAKWRHQGWGIRICSVELRVVLPILRVFSCSSIWRFGVGFASCWLQDPIGTFWGPLIFFSG